MSRRLRGLRGRDRRGLRRFGLEALESRQLLATFTVTETGDTDTPGTLRWAINQANASSGQDTISFAIPGAGPHTIQPQTGLPTITDQVTLNGGSQDPLAETPQIEIDGSAAGASIDGLRFSAGATTTASGSIVSDLAINRFSGAAIAILSGANSIAVRSNFLGTDPTGLNARPNAVGVRIDGSFSNTVGGVTTDFRNLISGNSSAGVQITGATGLSNVVQANVIGLALNGNSALPNQGPGILISGDGTANSGARSNTIGGSLAAARNFISGNTGPGIRITDAGATGNQIQGNFIGTNTSGTAAVANSIGVEIRNSASANSVGGAAASLRNVIAGNTQVDVLIENSDSNQVAGNLIGTNSDGNVAIAGNAPGGVGLIIRNGADSNTVGGVTASAGNVISGHQDAGVWIRGTTVSGDPVSTGNILQGNVIGAAIGGSVALPNLVGLRISDGATNSTIGGTASGARNVISGNTDDGIKLEGATTTGLVIQGNLIGTAADGSTALANGDNGILIDGPVTNSIGGSVAGAGNTIAFNGLTGVRILSGTGNSIRRNSIFSNGDLGIIVPAGLQNAPTLTAASTSGTTTTVTGSLNAAAGATFTIDFYSSVVADPSGAGEGQNFLGSTTVTTDASGLANFSAALTPAAGLGLPISALAVASNGNTSQFAVNVNNSQPSADIVLTMTAAATPPAPDGKVPTSTLFTYTITVKNDGPTAVTNVVVTDPLPAGTTFVGGTSSSGTISQSGSTITVTIPTLADDQTATITLTIVSPSTIPTGGTISNTATAAAGTGGSDPNTGNNSATITTDVVQGVDLSLNQTVTPNPAFVDGLVTIVLTVTNLSSVAATNVTVVDTLPASFTIVDTIPSQGTASHTGNVVTALLGTMPIPSATGAGSVATVTITARPTTVGTNLASNATATADQPQTVANDNIANVTITVQAGPAPSTTAPKITSLTREGRGVHPARITLRFDQAMNPQNTIRITNYRLFYAGPDGAFGTSDDQRIPLRRVRYTASNNTATIFTYPPINLHTYVRLVVRGTPAEGVRGANGLFLDGKGNGQQGTDYVARFKGTNTPTTMAASALGARKPIKFHYIRG